MRKKRRIQIWAIYAVAVLCIGLMCLSATGATFTTQSDAPVVSDASIAQLKTPSSDAENIDGTVNGVPVTYSGTNDASTYVANDRSTQGQLFKTGSYPKGYVLTDFWVKHVLYSTYINNGSYYSVSVGGQFTVRIVDPTKAGTAGFVLSKEVATVSTGSTFPSAGTGGTGLWVHITLDTPVNLAPNTQYGFDLTSYSGSSYFELAGVYTDEYTGGTAYTCTNKEDLNTGTVRTGDRTFVIPFNNVPKIFASNPNPEDKATDVNYKTSLSWMPGIYADTHNIFWGTDFNDVNNATIASHAGVTLTEGLDVNNLDPGTLNFGATYYWRVDEVNAPSKPATYKGTTWSFTVEPYAYKLPKEYITVAVRNNSAKNDPNNTINEVGLDPNHMDQHSNSSGMWLSGTVSAADPAWIRFDFNRLYKIHEMLVWNYNSKLLLNSGFRQVLVEYSADGVSWTPIPSVTEFAKASGNMGYVYNTVVSFNDTAVKSVRITALSNWGTSYKNGGLSEIRFTYIPTRATIPSPEMDEANVAIDSALSWRPGREAVTHDVYISTNEQAIINGTAPAHTVSVNTYLPLLDLGRTYYWSVTEVNNAQTPKRWESDIWSFSTMEYASIDDFEDYNGTDGYYIWQTWDDGASSPANGGSQIGYINNPFIEPKIAQHGKQSAPVYYDNTGASNVSVVSRTFATALNWQVNGGDTLRLYYRGNPITFAEPSPGVITMSGEGTDIWGTSDQFRFAYKTLTGNGSIVARVDSLQRTNDWAKTGVMIRNTLDPNSIQTMAIMGANGTCSFQRRTTKGGTSLGTDVTGLGFPTWVKLTRTGNTITAQRSKDGVTWLSFETDPNTPTSVTISTLSNQVYIGIPVTSHTADVLAAATLSNISTTGTVSAGAWTVASIGDIDQAQGTNTIDALYVGIEDSTGKSAKVYAPANAVGSGSWVGWLIPYSQFTGVNMTKVKKLSIGVGTSTAPAKGKGLILIDNIGYGHTLVK